MNVLTIRIHLSRGQAHALSNPDAQHVTARTYTYAVSASFALAASQRSRVTMVSTSEPSQGHQ